MLETKLIDCSVNETNSLIFEYEAFGWYVINVQTIDKETYEIHQRHTPHGIRTTLTSKEDKYCSITFQRDNLIPNYSEIKKLENEYINSKNEFINGMYKYRERGINPGFLVPSIVTLSMSSIFLIEIFGENNTEAVIGLIIFLLIGLILMILGIIFKIKKNKENEIIRKSYSKSYNYYHKCIADARCLINNDKKSDLVANDMDVSNLEKNIDIVIEKIINNDDVYFIKTEKGKAVIISENKYYDIINKRKES